MRILLELPKLTDLRLKQAKEHLQALVDSSSSAIEKQLAVLVIKALDYDPIELNLSDLDFFRANYAEPLEGIVLNFSDDDSFDVKHDLFWLAFYLHAMQFEALTLKNSFGRDELELGAFLETNINHFPLDIQQRIRYLSYKLGADIANLRITKHAQAELSRIHSSSQEIKSAAESIDTWNSNLESWESKVNSQELRLKDQLVKLNFVGLSRAFQNLSKSKSTERTFHASLSLVIALVFIVTPIVVLTLHTKYKLFDLSDPYVVGPIAAFEFALLYFFRVALQNYSSAKAQLLQIKLRLELCAFVEGYAEFIEPLRTKGGIETLAKFESIVFSGISPDPQNVPSQFDGLDSLVQLLKTIKSDK